MSLQQTLPNIPHEDTSQPATAVASLPPATTRIRLWDLPVRIFHWSLLAAVSTAIVTGQLGGAWMTVHGKAGLTIIGLVVFRLAWGFLGSTYARFSTFVPTPGRLIAYFRGQWRGAGHNPLGALSVLALLGLLALLAGTGVFGNDDISFTGPLAALVSEELSYWLTGRHHQLATVLYALLVLHVVAIVFHERIKKDKLVKPMVTGWKDVASSAQPPRQAGPLALLAAVLLALGAVYGASGGWIQSLAGEQAPAVEIPAATPPARTPAW
jgi:cytochrome b